MFEWLHMRSEFAYILSNSRITATENTDTVSMIVYCIIHENEYHLAHSVIIV